MCVLAWPGSKRRIMQEILPLIPEKDVCSPFFGGGAIECELAKTRRVYGYDIMPSLVLFWNCVLKWPDEVAYWARKSYPMNKQKFIEIKKNFHMLYGTRRAAAFYILNQSSMTGMMSNYGQDRLNMKRFDDLQEFKRKKLTVKLMPFNESIPLNPYNFLYCDPPYCELLLDKRVYRDPTWKKKPRFDHELLAELLTSRDSWILHYDDCEKVRKLYDGYKIMRPSWRYGMGNRRMASEEIVILSDDVKLPSRQTNIFEHVEP